MAHYAEVENGIVTRVLVVDDGIKNVQKFLAQELNLGGTWIQTSYNTFGGKHLKGGTPLHMNYAGIGSTWDGTGFASPKPFPSWTLDKSTYLWNAPTSMPDDGKLYEWDEESLSWIELVT